MKFIIFLLILTAFNFRVFSQCLPVASFPFSGNANDVSGNNNNGILAGVSANPVLTTDRFGNANSAYQFGGFYNRNWIKVPNSPSLKFTSQLSVSLWFKQCFFDGMNGYGSYGPNGNLVLFSKAGDGISTDPGFWGTTATDSNNLLHINFNNTNTSGFTPNFAEDTTVACFDKCEWVHCVIVIDNNTWKMYLNGELRKQKIINSADFTLANTRDLYFGRMGGGSIIWYPYNGVLDDINIYNCALSQSDVTSLFANYKDPLSVNNLITIDSINISNPTCDTSNGNISVFAKSNNGPYQYSINSGVSYQNSNIFSNLSPGNYKIRVKSPCTTTDTTVKLNTSALVTPSISISASTGNTICAGTNVTFTATPTNGGTTPSYQWKLNSDSVGTNSPTYSNNSLVNGDVVVCTMTSNVSCTTSPTATSNSIKINIPLSVNLGKDTSFCPSDFIILKPNNTFSHYLWSNGDTIKNIKVTNSGKYWVQVQDEYGCTSSDTITVTNKLCGFFIPNAFTPNNDGTNDVFKPILTEHFIDYRFLVYNRWGEKVFETKDYIKGWDGTFKGIPQEPGTYVWYCEVKMLDNLNNNKMKGFVILIR